jgi:hypothetical protein
MRLKTVVTICWVLLAGLGPIWSSLCMHGSAWALYVLLLGWPITLGTLITSVLAAIAYHRIGSLRQRATIAAIPGVICIAFNASLIVSTRVLELH